MLFKARIVKDKSNASSAEATGHALSSEVRGAKEKQFEKLETIAVGRALALLGYAASGEVASSEEMAEFLEHRELRKREAINEAVESLESCETLDSLKTTFTSLGVLMRENEVIAAKDAMKKKLAGASDASN